MRIDKITLENFGSYEGEISFDTRTNELKNIVLIGGKNGAGKTTLFTAMKVCLYGYMSMGYKSQNAYYTRAITKYLNNTAKMSRPTCASVSMVIKMNNGRDMDTFIVKRSWSLTDTLIEGFSVSKNGNSLSNSEIADFEKYILNIIPPELFNLYFFDGEKIADFFLEEGGNSRIKAAFLTLCGYDTFEIMRRNFKRIGTSDTTSGTALQEYIQAKEAYEQAQRDLFDLQEKMRICTDSIANCDAEIDLLEKNYHQKGGITETEWNQKLAVLREEEKKRESYNSLLKKWANDIVPFIMIREQICNVQKQIMLENDAVKYRYFCEILDSPLVKSYITDIPALKDTVCAQYGAQSEIILDLSLEQSSKLLSQISTILNFERDKIEKCKKAIKRSLSITAKTRSELDNSSITSVQDYMKSRARLFEDKSNLLAEQVSLEQQISTQKEIVISQESALARVQSKLENELKKASINDISARAIVMLDKLQQSLYQKQIGKVEESFRIEIRSLMRKKKFIDDISIDDDFGVHIYKKEVMATSTLAELICTHTADQVKSLLGVKAMKVLADKYKATSLPELQQVLSAAENELIEMPIEIDKSSLSNGEKQIFIMALYHSLIKLCNHEVPFIIDTPFARIDTEHRINISKNFFSKLKGQIFILSTNEELDSRHVSLLSEKIAVKYMLENTDNKRTTIAHNSYFEV